MTSLTDPTTRLRYDWVTPPEIVKWICEWDKPETDKVAFLRANPISLTLYVRDARCNPCKSKGPEQRVRDRAYNAKLLEERKKLSPEELAERKRLRRNKIRGTGLA